MLTFNRINKWLDSHIFAPKGSKLRSDYVCPMCGSGNWKFPNPVKPSSFLLNVPDLVNSLFECRDCGNIGVFFAVDDAKQIKPAKSQVKLVREQFVLTYFSSRILLITSIFLLVFIDFSIGGVIIL